MKYLIIALMALALAVGTAHAVKLMTFGEVEACVQLDHEIFAAKEELDAQQSILKELKRELSSLEERTKALRVSADEKKSAGDRDAYKGIVKEYNETVEKNSEKYRAYNELASKSKTMSEALKALEDEFIPGCGKRKFYKPDLKKACRESPYPDTPFCTSNIK